MFNDINIFVCVKFFMFIVIVNAINAEVLRCYVCVDCDDVNETHIDICIKPDIPVSETPTTSEPSTIWTSTKIQETTVTNRDAPTIEVVTEQSSTDVTSTYSTTMDASSTTVVSTDTTSESTSTIGDPTSSVTEEPITAGATLKAGVKVRNAPRADRLEEAIINVYSIELPNSEEKTAHESDSFENFAKTHVSVSDGSELNEYANYASSFYNAQMVQAEHRLRRAISSGEERSSPSETRCVVTKFIENSKTRIKRGCSFISGNAENRCRELIGEDFVGNLIHCSVCDESLCNSASRSAITVITFSIFLIFMSNM